MRGQRMKKENPVIETAGAASTDPGTIKIAIDGKVVVVLDASGGVEFGEGIDLTSAAAAFWLAVAQSNSFTPVLSSLGRRIFELSQEVATYKRLAARYEKILDAKSPEA
jgi:hypothetical protein